MRKLFALTLVGVMAAFGLAACGDDDEAAGDDNVLRVTENEYKFTIDDGDVKAGTVTLDVENVGNELHMFGACQLKPGKTKADALKSAQSEDESAFAEVCVDPSGIDKLGGGLTPDGNLKVTATGLEAGNYVALCFLPDKSGKPHFLRGMIGEFKVGEGDGAETPEADVTYTATKEKLDGPKKVDAGDTTIQVDVEKGAPDEVILLKVKDGKTTDDVQTFFDSMDAGGFYTKAKSPVDLLYFAFDSTDSRWFNVDLTPGKWAIVVNDSDNEDQQKLDPDEDPHVVQFTVA